jgi:hypothetical protein
MTTIDNNSLDKKGNETLVEVRSSTRSKTEQMTAYELSRWCAMLDAVEVIDKKLVQMKMSTSDKWVKPIAIQKYVDEKYQDILHDVLTKQENS